MAASSGPDVIDAGLVLALDAADRNSFDSNENLLTRSEEFNDGVWAKSQISITSNAAIAPDGSLTADKLVEASISNTFYYISQGPAGGNATYTHSLFAKQAETDRHLYFEVGNCRVGINISNGTIFSGPSTFGTGWSNPTVSIIPYPNGWYRCIITGTADNTVTSVSAKIHTATLTGGAGGIVYTGNGTSGIYIWGAQLERGSSPSPYYPTTATTKTRGTTLIDLTGRGNTGTLTNGPTYSSANGGSIVFDGVDDYVDCGKTASQLGVYDADYTFDAWVYPTNLSSDKTMFGTDQTASRQGLHLVFRGGAIYQGHYGADFSAGSATINAWNNISYTYVKSSSSASIYKNGVLQGSGSIASFIGTTNILVGRWASNYYFSGTGSNYKIYNRALTAAEIQQNFNATRRRFGI